MERSIFTEEHEIFRKSVRKFLEKEAIPYLEEWEKEKQVPLFGKKQLNKDL